LIKRRKFQWTLFIVGVFLLITNIFGLFTSLRNPEIYNEKKTGFANDITLTEDQVYSVINSDRSDIRKYVSNVTYAVNKGMADYWDDEGIDKYHLRVPFQENYLLFLASYIMPQKFQKFEFMDYHRAIERGVGMCSEHSIILSEVLNEKGIKTKMIGLSGHVGISAQVDEKTDEWWVLDGLYGVVIPFSLDKIQKNPDIIGPYYSEKGYDTKTITALEGIYGAEGNFVEDGFGIGDYSILTNYFEKTTYILIWVIPLFLISPFLLFSIFHKTGR
jgi:hypothetical protein